MVYHITNYTKEKANQLGVTVKPSTYATKKIDVYKNGIKIASIGAVGYPDYPTYLKTTDKKYADERRRLYKIRHKNDKNVVGSNGYYADKLLW